MSIASWRWRHDRAAAQPPADRLARRAGHRGRPCWSISASACRCIVGDYLRPGVDVFLQSENGVIGVGPLAAPDKADTDLVDAGSRRITLRAGASFVDSSWSFAMIRGGHIDVTILGAFEVAANGDLANWDMRVPNRGPLVGGAHGPRGVRARSVWVIMEHVTRKGAPRLLEKCTLPLTAVRCVSARLHRSGRHRRDAAGFRGARDARRHEPRQELQATHRRAAELRAGLQAAGSAADRAAGADAYELHRAERRVAALRAEGSGQHAGADPRDGRHDGELGPAWLPLLAAERRVVRYDTRGAGLSAENPRRPDDRHHDRRSDRAARRARHQARSRWPAPRSAARSRCIRRCDFPNASPP